MLEFEFTNIPREQTGEKRTLLLKLVENIGEFWWEINWQNWIDHIFWDSLFYKLIFGSIFVENEYWKFLQFDGSLKNYVKVWQKHFKNLSSTLLVTHLPKNLLGFFVSVHLWTVFIFFSYRNVSYWLNIVFIE